jgi:transcriptional regulator with XRE-family HTH domain
MGERQQIPRDRYDPDAFFGFKLRWFCQERHIDLKVLAYSAYVSVQHLYRLLKGEQQPSLQVAARIAHALAVPLNVFAPPLKQRPSKPKAAGRRRRRPAGRIESNPPTPDPSAGGAV